MENGIWPNDANSGGRGIAGTQYSTAWVLVELFNSGRRWCHDMETSATLVLFELYPFHLSRMDSPCKGSVSRGFIISWWRHQMEHFSALLAICVGNSPVTGEFPSQRPVTRSFGVFFHLRLNKRLSEQSWGWWFETPSRPLWRQFNVLCLSPEQVTSSCSVTVALARATLSFQQTLDPQMLDPPLGQHLI